MGFEVPATGSEVSVEGEKGRVVRSVSTSRGVEVTIQFDTDERPKVGPLRPIENHAEQGGFVEPGRREPIDVQGEEKVVHLEDVESASADEDTPKSDPKSKSSRASKPEDRAEKR